MTGHIVPRGEPKVAAPLPTPGAVGSTPTPATSAPRRVLVLKLNGRAATVFQALDNLARRVGGAA